jgi:hypothetical protein
MRTILFVSLMAFFNTTLLAQSTKTINSVNQFWFGYNNQTRLHNKWGIWADLQLYSKDMSGLSLGISEPRIGLIYYLNDNNRLSAGYAYLTYYPQAGHLRISQPENRYWQQYQLYSKGNRLRIMQWYRLEERFVRKVKNDDSLADGNTFSYRFRYMLYLTYPLGRQGFLSKFGITAFDELYVNFGKSVVNNYFDQNRLFGGISYMPTPHVTFQMGFTYEFQQLASGNKYKEIDALRLAVYHNLDLHPKK